MKSCEAILAPRKKASKFQIRFQPKRQGEKNGQENKSMSLLRGGNSCSCTEVQTLPNDVKWQWPAAENYCVWQGSICRIPHVDTRQEEREALLYWLVRNWLRYPVNVCCRDDVQYMQIWRGRTNFLHLPYWAWIHSCKLPVGKAIKLSTH